MCCWRNRLYDDSVPDHKSTTLPGGGSAAIIGGRLLQRHKRLPVYVVMQELRDDAKGEKLMKNHSLQLKQ